MTDDALAATLRAVIPPTDADAAVPRPDLWHRIVTGPDPVRHWPWLDMGLAAAVAGALLLRPDLLFVLAWLF
jgi:hypothetical protein